MATRAERERDEYNRLHAKYGPKAKLRRRPEPDEEDGDADGVFMFRGKAADRFLDGLFGPNKPTELDDDQDDDDQDDDDQDDDDQDDDDQDDDDYEEDPPAPRGPRFFGGKGGRG